MRKEWKKPELRKLYLKNTNEGGVPCPEEPATIDGLPNWPDDSHICSYPGCNHFKFSTTNPYCFCHRNSSLPGGGPTVGQS